MRTPVIAAVLAIAQSGCSLAASNPRPGLPPQVEPECREITGAHAILDGLGALGTGSVAALGWTIIYQPEWGGWDPDAKSWAALIQFATVAVTAASVGFVASGIGGQMKSSRCRRAKEAHRRYRSSLSPAQQAQLDHDERERRLAPVRAAQARRAMELRRRTILGNLRQQLDMRVFAKDNRLILRATGDLNACAALEWTAAVGKHRRDLEGVKLAEVSCMADGHAIWSGPLGDLPGSVYETACQPHIATWSRERDRRKRVQLLQTMPKGCLESLNSDRPDAD